MQSRKNSSHKAQSVILTNNSQHENSIYSNGNNSIQHINIYEQNKRQRKQMEDLLQLMSNRVNLLFKQQNKTQKKISQTQEKTKKIVMNKSVHESQKFEKELLNQLASQFLQENLNQKNQSRIKKKFMKEQQQYYLLLQKHQKSKQIRTESSMYDAYRIAQQQQQIQENFEKSNLIKMQYAKGSDNIRQFFESKKIQAIQTNQLKAFEETQKQQKLQETLQQIQNFEGFLAEKLNKTLRQGFNTSSDYEKAIQLHPSQYLRVSQPRIKRQLSANLKNQQNLVESKYLQLVNSPQPNYYNISKIAGRNNLQNGIYNTNLRNLSMSLKKRNKKNSQYQ